MRARILAAVVAVLAALFGLTFTVPTAQAAPARPASVTVVPPGCISAMGTRHFDAKDRNGNVVYYGAVSLRDSTNGYSWTYSTSGASVEQYPGSWFRNDYPGKTIKIDVSHWSDTSTILNLQGGTLPYQNSSALYSVGSWVHSNAVPQLAIHWYDTGRPSVGGWAIVQPC